MPNEMVNVEKYSPHKVLAHSYFLFLLFFLLGIVFQIMFNIKVFHDPLSVPFGFVLLVISSFWIFWAQKTSRNFKKEIINKDTFCRGPYCYTRVPTHLGLLFMMLGFGMIVNSFFIILFTLLAFILGKFIFLDKEEKILTQKYGAPYLEYKKSVKF